MSNVLGQAYALTVMTPIIAGREDALRAHLEALPVGPQSPLAKLTRTHVARWVIMPRLYYQGPPQAREELRSQWLVFASDFDGDLDSYLDSMCEHMGDECDRIWEHCVGYPGVGERQAFKRYMRHGQIDTTVNFGAYPDASVEQVRASLALRGRLRDFAERAQHMTPEELLAAYKRELAAGRAAPELQAS